jgi:hypothetical protein
MGIGTLPFNPMIGPIRRREYPQFGLSGMRATRLRVPPPKRAINRNLVPSRRVRAHEMQRRPEPSRNRVLRA